MTTTCGFAISKRGTKCLNYPSLNDGFLELNTVSSRSSDHLSQCIESVLVKKQMKCTALSAFHYFIYSLKQKYSKLIWHLIRRKIILNKSDIILFLYVNQINQYVNTIGTATSSTTTTTTTTKTTTTTTTCRDYPTKEQQTTTTIINNGQIPSLVQICFVKDVLYVKPPGASASKLARARAAAAGFLGS